jgi:hypothetical protein
MSAEHLHRVLSGRPGAVAAGHAGTPVSIALLSTLLFLPAPILGGLAAQEQLPFSPGEQLEYRVQLDGLGTVGSGTMRVTGPIEVRGRTAWLLDSDIRGRVAFLAGRDRTRSWIDPTTMSTLRFEKSERTPASRRHQSVEIYPAERRWVAEDGRGGDLATDLPLDELSFIYFIRTLGLEDGAWYRLDRHFDEERNPVLVTVLRRESIEVGAGRFEAVVVEMRVHDPRRYRGEGIITLHLTDDDYRLPVRIESAVPGIGTTILTLKTHTQSEIPAAPGLKERD